MQRILSTTIMIFDSTLTLLGNDCPSTAILAHAARRSCVRNVLSLMGIGRDAEDAAARKAVRYLGLDSL